LEDFEDLSNGATSDTGATAWTSVRDAGTFQVSNGTFLTSGNSASPGVWTSEVISVSGPISLSVDVDDLDNRKEPADFVNAYYILDGGSQVLFGSVSDDISPQTLTVTGLLGSTVLGSTVQIVIESDVSTGNEFYVIDNVTVTEDGGSAKSFSGSSKPSRVGNSNNETSTFDKVENENDNIGTTYIYPNPTRDYIHIRLGNLKTDILNIGLYDLTGKLTGLYNKSDIILTADGVEVLIENIRNGTYMVQVNFENSEPRYYKVVVRN